MSQYKIAIFLRVKQKPNFFRNLILNSLAQDFDNYVVCSAFFQEPYIQNNGKKIGKFSTSQEILNYLARNTNHKEINVFGLYPKNQWPRQFNISCTKLYQAKSPHLRFNFFKFKHQSHAKIFIAKKRSIPELAIIGSSNLSAGAFADNNPRWNQESDVVFWNDKDVDAARIIRHVLDEINESARDDNPSSFVYIADYTENHPGNRGIPMQEKLQLLEQEIIANASVYF